MRGVGRLLTAASCILRLWSSCPGVVPPLLLPAAWPLCALRQRARWVQSHSTAVGLTN